MNKQEILNRMTDIGLLIASLSSELEAAAEAGEIWGGDSVLALDEASDSLSLAWGLFHRTEIQGRSPAEHEAHRESLATVAHWGDEGF